MTWFVIHRATQKVVFETNNEKFARSINQLKYKVIKNEKTTTNS